MTKEITKKNILGKFEYGSILFGVGILIAVIAGIIDLKTTSIKIILSTLIVIGIFVGILNIKKDEALSFLVASLVFVILMSPIVTVQSGSQVFGTNIISYLFQSVFQNNAAYQIVMKISIFLIGLILPAALIVSLKTIFLTAKNN